MSAGVENSDAFFGFLNTIFPTQSNSSNTLKYIHQRIVIIINICSTCIYGPSPHFSIFSTPQYTALRHRCLIKNQELLILRECLGSSPVRFVLLFFLVFCIVFFLVFFLCIVPIFPMSLYCSFLTAPPFF